MNITETNYPKKCWYVAASSEEVGDSPLGRRLLGQEVVLWRSSDGDAIAFENRCAHRAFPLSHSSVQGNRLVCGYHGCTYEADGTCSSTPAQPHVPTGMRVTAYPVIEQPPFIWIWLGPPGAAASSRPSHLRWVNDPTWATFSNAWQVDANYMMVHEHYLDFSYATVLHRDDVPREINSMPAFNDVEVTETTVSYTRHLPDAQLTDWEADATGLDRERAYKRRESGTFVSPAVHRQYWEISAGDGALYTTTRTHAITPESENSTHVFMQASRNYSLDSDAVAMRLASFLSDVSQRDNATLEMASAHSGYDGWRSGVEFQADAAALRARRIVGVMLAKEAGRSALRPGFAPSSRKDSLSPRRTVQR